MSDQGLERGEGSHKVQSKRLVEIRAICGLCKIEERMEGEIASSKVGGARIVAGPARGEFGPKGWLGL